MCQVSWGRPYPDAANVFEVNHLVKLQSYHVHVVECKSHKTLLWNVCYIFIKGIPFSFHLSVLPLFLPPAMQEISPYQTDPLLPNSETFFCGLGNTNSTYLVLPPYLLDGRSISKQHVCLENGPACKCTKDHQLTEKSPLSPQHKNHLKSQIKSHISLPRLLFFLNYHSKRPPMQMTISRFLMGTKHSVTSMMCCLLLVYWILRLDAGL